MTVDARPRFGTVEELLEEARSRIERLTPVQAHAAVGQGATIVDIRPAWQRAADGEVPGSLIVERNHLEWRLHPASDARLVSAGTSHRWIVLCTEGYTSSLAAASLRSLGIDAADVDGGIHAWRRAGLPIAAGPTPVETVVQPDPLMHHSPAPDGVALAEERRGAP